MSKRSAGSSSEKSRRKEIVKDIILKLHQGLSVQQAKERFEKEVGSISSAEIAEIEQSLISDGLSPEEIQKFCNVHALLFESTLKQAAAQEESPAHPVYLFRQENREIEKLTGSFRELVSKAAEQDAAQWSRKMNDLLGKLKGLELHYTRKEQLLFPFLERYGFTGPSKVMWGKDDEIRAMLKDAAANVDLPDRQGYSKTYLTPLLEEVEGMIFKEENILFPAALEKLSVDDWVEILKDSEEVGYAFITKPADTSALIWELKDAVMEEPFIKDDHTICLPTGELGLKELMNLLNTLPIDVTFIDKEDTVRYFSSGKDRIFVRTKSVIGRKVQNCHPPKSLEIVEKILGWFKTGKKDFVDFWINLGGKLVYIRYFAVRDERKQYLGTLEVTQEITGIRKLEGEKRLLDQED
jgi:DUF438 domain-containing protein